MKRFLFAALVVLALSGCELWYTPPVEFEHIISSAECQYMPDFGDYSILIHDPRLTDETPWQVSIKVSGVWVLLSTYGAADANFASLIVFTDGAFGFFSPVSMVGYSLRFREL